MLAVLENDLDKLWRDFGSGSVQYNVRTPILDKTSFFNFLGGFKRKN